MFRIACARKIIPSLTHLENGALYGISKHRVDVETRKRLKKVTNERSRLLSSRRWDNTVGSLNRENLHYFTGKLEKYASQTTEEKIIGLQESSSFLGALILDKNGIVKSNVYNEGS